MIEQSERDAQFYRDIMLVASMALDSPELEVEAAPASHWADDTPPLDPDEAFFTLPPGDARF